MRRRTFVCLLLAATLPLCAAATSASAAVRPIATPVVVVVPTPVVVNIPTPITVVMPAVSVLRPDVTPVTIAAPTAIPVVNPIDPDDFTAVSEMGEEQPWPENGIVYTNPDDQGGDVRLLVTIEQIGDGYATYVKLCRVNGDVVSGLFIGGEGTVSTDLPEGTYVVKAGVGKTWYGTRDAFGSAGHYEKLTFENNATETVFETGYQYTLIINTSIIDPTIDDVGSIRLSWSDF